MLVLMLVLVLVVRVITTFAATLSFVPAGISVLVRFKLDGAAHACLRLHALHLAGP